MPLQRQATPGAAQLDVADILLHAEKRVVIVGHDKVRALDAVALIEIEDRTEEHVRAVGAVLPRRELSR